MNQANDLWKITTENKAKPKNPIFIEGLPGIGNVGKVVIDYIIEKSKAKLFASYFSYTLPNSVFVNENNLVALPAIEIYYARIQNQDYLLMTGDVQPTDEVSSYTFCELLLSQAKEWGVSDIITLGGIGLQEAPIEPQVFCTGNTQEFIKRFVDKGANQEVYGMVGPIIGVSGLLLGLSKKHDIPAVTLLAETLGHPMYLGLRGAKSILQLLSKTYGLTFDLEDIDNEIDDMESETEETDHRHNPKIKAINKLKRIRDTNYIG